MVNMNYNSEIRGVIMECVETSVCDYHYISEPEKALLIHINDFNKGAIKVLIKRSDLVNGKDNIHDFMNNTIVCTSYRQYTNPIRVDSAYILKS